MADTAINLQLYNYDCGGRTIVVKFDRGFKFYSGVITDPNGNSWRSYYIDTKTPGVGYGTFRINSFNEPYTIVFETYNNKYEFENNYAPQSTSQPFYFHLGSALGIPAPTNLQIVNQQGRFITIRWDAVPNATLYAVYFGVQGYAPSGFTVDPPLTEALVTVSQYDVPYYIFVRALNNNIPNNCNAESLNSNVLIVNISPARCARIQDKMDVDFTRMYYHLDTDKGFHLLKKLFMKVSDTFKSEAGSEQEAYDAVKSFLIRPESLKKAGGELKTLHLPLWNLLFADPTAKKNNEGNPKESETQLFLDRYFAGMKAEDRKAYFKQGYPGGEAEFEKLYRVLEFQHANLIDPEINAATKREMNQLRFVFRGAPPKPTGDRSEDFGFIFLYDKPSRDIRTMKDNLLLHLSLTEPKPSEPLLYHLTDKCHGELPQLVAGKAGKDKYTAGGYHVFYRFGNNKWSKESGLSTDFIIHPTMISYPVTRNTLYQDGSRNYNLSHFPPTEKKKLWVPDKVSQATINAALATKTKVHTDAIITETFALPHNPKDIRLIKLTQQYLDPKEKKKVVIRLDVDGNVIFEDGTILTPDNTSILPDGRKIKNGDTEYPDGSIDYKDGRKRRVDGSILYLNGTVLNPDGSIDYTNGRKMNSEGRRYYPGVADFFENGQGRFWTRARDGHWHISDPGNYTTKKYFIDSKKEKAIQGREKGSWTKDGYYSFPYSHIQYKPATNTTPAIVRKGDKLVTISTNWAGGKTRKQRRRSTNKTRSRG